MLRDGVASRPLLSMTNFWEEGGVFFGGVLLIEDTVFFAFKSDAAEKFGAVVTTICVRTKIDIVRNVTAESTSAAIAGVRIVLKFAIESSFISIITIF